MVPTQSRHASDNINVNTFVGSRSTKSSKNLLTVNSSNSNMLQVTDIDSFQCYYTNIQSVKNKFDEFEDRINSIKPLIIGLTETWLKPEIQDAEVFLRVYELFRCDRPVVNGGGALMYIHESLSSNPCSQLDEIGLEDAVFRIINLNERNSLLVAVIYRSTSSSNENNEKLLEAMNMIKNLKKHFSCTVDGRF